MNSTQNCFFKLRIKVFGNWRVLQLSYIQTIDIFTLSVYIVNVIACLKSSHSSNARMSYSESCSQKIPAYHYYRRQKQSHREPFFFHPFQLQCRFLWLNCSSTLHSSIYFNLALFAMLFHSHSKIMIPSATARNTNTGYTEKFIDFSLADGDGEMFPSSKKKLVTLSVVSLDIKRIRPGMPDCENRSKQVVILFRWRRV